MLKRLGWCLCLLWLCSACTVRPPAPSTAGAPAVSAPTGGSVDTGCSYFHFLWGRVAETGHRFDEALDAYQKSLACDPGAEYVMRELAVYMVKLGRKEEAVRLLDQLLSRHPKDTNILSLKANLFVAMGKNDEAAAAYNAVLALEPANGNAMLLLGSLYARTGRYDKARQVLERLVKLDDRSFIGYQYLAKLYREVKEYDRAAAAYEKALALHWLPSLALEAADLYEYRNQFDKVIAICRRVLVEDPDEEKARQQLVRIYLRQGKLDKALAELKEYRRHARDVDEVDYTIGRVLLENGRYDQAISHFRDMLEREPDSASARYLLALSYGTKGDTKEAARLLRGITPKDDVYEDATMLLVELLVRDKALAEAEAVLTKAVGEAASRRPRFYAGLASLYHRQGRDGDGRKIFQQGLGFYPDDPEIHYDYGLFLDRIGAGDEALTAMEKVLVLEPNNAYALNYIGYTWADSGRKLKEAKAYIERAVELKPDDGFVRDSLGWVYFKLGDAKRAIAELQKALELAMDPVILEHLGDVQHAVGNRKAAIDAYGRAGKLYEKEQDRQRVEAKAKGLRKTPSP